MKRIDFLSLTIFKMCSKITRYFHEKIVILLSNFIIYIRCGRCDSSLRAPENWATPLAVRYLRLGCCWISYWCVNSCYVRRVRKHFRIDTSIIIGGLYVMCSTKVARISKKKNSGEISWCSVFLFWGSFKVVLCKEKRGPLEGLV